MAVTPGNLPLEIIRGIEFEAQVLQCKANSLTVAGTLSPNAVGTYKLSGNFEDKPLFILESTPSFFVYYNPVEGGYVLARTLTSAALTDYWSPTIALPDEPSGTYEPHGANSGEAAVTDSPTDLTDYTPAAEVKTRIDGNLLIDLNPSITDAANGEITIPSIPSATTEVLTKTGTFTWDLVLTNTNTSERSGPYVAGQFVIRDNVTQD